VVGHIAFSPVTIFPQPGRWYSLGPVSVRPDRQRQGIGKSLIQEGLRLLKAAGVAVGTTVALRAPSVPTALTSDDESTLKEPVFCLDNG
jgi:GNAT superfamily N-acetyltransferase